MSVTSLASRKALRKPRPNWPISSAASAGELEGELLAQLAGVAPADGGEVGADLLLGQAVAVVGDGDDAAAGVEADVDARAVVALAGLDLAADAGVVGVLDQFADADLLGGVEVLGQDLEQAGQVQVELQAVGHWRHSPKVWPITRTPGCVRGLLSDDIRPGAWPLS